MEPIVSLESSVQQLDKQAEDYLSQKKYSEAIAVCQQALKIQPNLKSYKTLGLAFQSQGQLETSLQCYVKALEIQPDDTEVYHNIASIYAQKKQWQDAIIIYQVALRLEPSFCKDNPSLFQFLLNFDQLEKVIDAILNSKEIDVQTISSQDYITFGEELEKQQKTQLAIVCYRQALKREPKLLKAYQKLGNLLRKKKQWLAAVKVYQKGLEFFPNYCWFYNHLGKIFVELKQWKRSVKSYKKSIEINPDFCWSYYQLGQALIQLNQWKKAKKIYIYLVDNQPDFQPAYFKLIEILMHLEKPEEAIRIYNKINQQNNNIEFYFNLGKFLIKYQKCQEAIKVYRHMIGLYSTCWWYFHTLGDLFRQLNCWNEAILAYTKAIKLNPNSDYSYKNLGDSLEKQSRFSEAIAAYQKAAEINSCSYYFIVIGKILIQQHQYQAAIPYFIEALREQPDNLEIYAELSKILEKQGMFQEYLDCKGLAIVPKVWLSLYLKLPDNLWVNTETHNTRIQYSSIYSATEVQLKPPKTIDSNIHVNFSRVKVKSTEAFVASILDGRAWYSSVSSAVITSENQLVSNLSTGCGELFWGLKNIPNLLKIEGNVLFLSVKFGLVYYHWFFDILARIDLILRSSIDFNNIDKIIVNRYQTSYEKETIKILGIPEDKIIESCKFPYIKASNLIVPSPLPGPLELKTPKWSINFLRNSFLPHNNFRHSNQKRIYISRKKSNSRKVINEEEVIKFLNKFDVESVRLESMTIKEQVSCMRNAEVVIAPHGSGLTNLIFCSPATKVIEFVVPSYPVICYWELSSMCNLEYYYLIGEPLNKASSTIDFGEDICVNLQSLATIIQLAGIA
ncbi:tetratricopeptide repeat protein [Limnoraphis robusta]|uniref:tetratricopeptide repeat protein n=1 Tax=Limnoraphis robusta TaxID=1118279 RepID=UPI002B1E915A|nr:tetratricopeptide repeat protein [Limnoraphis robusta]MEA5496179.1 tetratricopeptide repeat protein [Limnoraphis robusta BA-68 BA1]